MMSEYQSKSGTEDFTETVAGIGDCHVFSAKFFCISICSINYVMILIVSVLAVISTTDEFKMKR